MGLGEYLLGQFGAGGRECAGAGDAGGADGPVIGQPVGCGGNVGREAGGAVFRRLYIGLRDLAGGRSQSTGSLSCSTLIVMGMGSGQAAMFNAVVDASLIDKMTEDIRRAVDLFL